MNILPLLDLKNKMQLWEPRFLAEQPPRPGPKPKLSWTETALLVIAKSYFKIRDWIDLFEENRWKEMEKIGVSQNISYGRFLLHMPRIRHF